MLSAIGHECRLRLAWFRQLLPRLILDMIRRLIAILPLGDPSGWPAPGTPGAKALAGFRAHIRRKFKDIFQADGSPMAEGEPDRKSIRWTGGWMPGRTIRHIAGLHAVEKQAPGRPPDEPAQLRQADAVPVSDDLGA